MSMQSVTLPITPAIVRLWQSSFVSIVCQGSESRWKPDSATWKTIEEPDTSARASKHEDERQNTFGENHGAVFLTEDLRSRAGYWVMKVFNELVTPSLAPRASTESTL